MNALRFIILLCLAGVFFHFWSKHRAISAANTAAAAVSTQPDANGFIPLPVPAEASPKKVLILAPPNCPKEAGRRADALERTLASAGIPYFRSGEAHFSLTDQAEADRLGTVMNGTLPIIFIKGKARNNPTTSEIIAEYNAALKR